jgi:hypothetical protein
MPTDWKKYTLNLHDFLSVRVFLSIIEDPFVNVGAVGEDNIFHESEMYAYEIMQKLRDVYGWNQVNSATTIRPGRSNTPFLEVLVGEQRIPERKIWNVKAGNKARLWRILGEITGNLDIKHRGMEFYDPFSPSIIPITKIINPTTIEYSVSGSFLTPYRIVSGNYFYNPIEDQIIVKDEYVGQSTGYQQVLDECKRRNADSDMGQRTKDSGFGLYR